MEQLRLLLRDQKKEVAQDVIASQTTMNAALLLCKQISGLEDKQIAGALGIDPGNFSLIWAKNGNKRQFPENQLIDFMTLCSNIVPLIWLAQKMGYGLHPLMSEKDREIEELRAALTEKEKEIETLIKYRQKGLI